MGYTIRFKDSDRVVECNYFGNVTAHEAQQCRLERSRDPDRFKQVRVIISDFTDAKFHNVRYDSIKADVNATGNEAAINPDITLIGVMPGCMETGISRMWKAQSAGLPWDVHVVRTRPECDEIARQALEES
jgi:hypothetical protein